MVQVQISLLIEDRASQRRAATEAAPFLRRDYRSHQEIFIDLSAGIKTAVEVNLSTIQFLMAQVVDESGAIVNIYRNRSPESWQFSDHFGSWDIENCTSISLMSDVDARVHLIVGGEV